MNRKIDATDGTTYYYNFGNGQSVKLTAGEDGVTEEMICHLKRMDNREYEKNLDAAGRKLDAFERKQWDEKHPGEVPRRKWNRSLDFVNCDGKSFIENIIYHEMVKQEQELWDIERLYELVEEMPPKRKQVLSLYLAGYKQTEIARELGISPSTVRDHMNDAKEFIRKNFFETRTN